MHSLLWMTLFCAAFQTSFGDVKRPSGPVSSLMEDLSFNTASITDEMALQLNNQIDRIGDTLLGQVEVILANAMDEMSEPIFVARKKLATESCQETWTIEELKVRIDQGLRNCTQDLVDLMDSFKEDAQLIVADIEKRAQEILGLPSVCQLKSGNPRSAVVLLDAAEGGAKTTTFTSSTSCFVEQIADINGIVADQLNRAKKLIGQTRQNGRLSVANGQRCATELANDVISYLDKSLEHC